MTEQVTKIPVTRALKVVKDLKAEINSYFNEKRSMFGISFGVSGERTNHAGINVETLNKVIQSDFDKIKSLVERMTRIKQKIVDSNSKTMVTINGVKMTVQDAIILKGTVEERKYLLKNLKQHKANALANIEKFQSDFDKQIEEILRVSVDEKTQTPDQMMEVRSRIRAEQNSLLEPKLLDPMNVIGFIEKLEQEIKCIVEDLDTELSISNSNTLIEID